MRFLICKKYINTKGYFLRISFNSDIRKTVVISKLYINEKQLADFIRNKKTKQNSKINFIKKIFINLKTAS